ncbi:MAG: single-stranded DNA-binding protein [Gemmatimonadota bacterium]
MSHERYFEEEPVLNRHEIIGTVVADPVLRHTGDGTPVTNLRVATHEPYKDGDGELREHSEFHPVTAWGRAAENLSGRLRQGALVYVAGPVRRTRNETGDGRVFHDAVIRLGGRNSDWQLLRKPSPPPQPDEPDEPGTTGASPSHPSGE